MIDLIFGVLTQLSAIFQLWRPVLVVEEAGVPGPKIKSIIIFYIHTSLFFCS
jgi:hypothetical protein